MTQIATIQVLPDSVHDFPSPAVLYALRQLARRAGVSAELFRSWRIETSDRGFVTVFVARGTDKRIRFPKADAELWKSIRKRTVRVSTAGWMTDPGHWKKLVPNFKIPFSTAPCDELDTLFRKVDSDCVECRVDLLATVFLTLSRFEETLPGPRDEHGRFPSSLSVAGQFGFLSRPIVDEYGVAFEQALSVLLPNWRPEPRRYRVKLGHDVDEIGVPFSVRSAIGHTIRRKRPDGTIRDLLSKFRGIDTAYQCALRDLIRLSGEFGLDSAIYWKSSRPSPFDSGYDPCEGKVLSLIHYFQDLGIEIGVHPGYHTFDSPDLLRHEVGFLQQLFRTSRLGGRQDFLRWSPDIWSQWDSLGLAYDSSVGFADRIGFRAGTASPFRPWLLREQREANLIEIPLLAMDGTLFSYMKLKPEDALAELRRLAALCRAFGGVFTLLWHHTTQFLRPWASIYRRLLQESSGADRYDWRNENGLV